MKFTKTESDENFPVGRWVSENGVWEVGFYPVLYGIRVRAGVVGSGCVVIDYCAGGDRVFALILFATVVQILSSLPETTTERKILQLFPTYQVKPINRAPVCWERLKELAAEVEEQGAITH